MTVSSSSPMAAARAAMANGTYAADLVASLSRPAYVMPLPVTVALDSLAVAMGGTR